jgi:hypothetical protein
MLGELLRCRRRRSDEGRTIEGREPSRPEKKDTKARYPYTVEPLDLSQDGAAVTMRTRLTGTFPGSSVELTYTFVLAGGKQGLRVLVTGGTKGVGKAVVVHRCEAGANVLATARSRPVRTPQAPRGSRHGRPLHCRRRDRSERACIRGRR